MIQKDRGASVITGLVVKLHPHRSGACPACTGGSVLEVERYFAPRSCRSRAPQEMPKTWPGSRAGPLQARCGSIESAVLPGAVAVQKGIECGSLPSRDWASRRPAAAKGCQRPAERPRRACSGRRQPSHARRRVSGRIRVTLYSTKWVDVKANGQDARPNGACTLYSTKRQRTFLEGRVETTPPRPSTAQAKANSAAERRCRTFPVLVRGIQPYFDD